MTIITPKKMILEFLNVSKSKLSSGTFVHVGKILGFEGNSVRVTLSRLKKRGLLHHDEEGGYELAEAGIATRVHISQWQTLADVPKKKWDGSFVIALTTDLPRTRKEITKRERALTMLGFRVIRTRIWIRPNNLETLDLLKKRLVSLGVEENLLLLTSSEFESGVKEDVIALWDIATLNENYRQIPALLDESRLKCETLNRDESAREYYLTGSRLLERVIQDPVLPSELIDVKARTAAIKALASFDVDGHKLWAEIFAEVAK